MNSGDEVFILCETLNILSYDTSDPSLGVFRDVPIVSNKLSSFQKHIQFPRLSVL